MQDIQPNKSELQFLRWLTIVFMIYSKKLWKIHFGKKMNGRDSPK